MIVVLFHSPLSRVDDTTYFGIEFILPANSSCIVGHALAKPVVRQTTEQECSGRHDLVELELVAFRAAVELERPSTTFELAGATGILKDTVHGDEFRNDDAAHRCLPMLCVHSVDRRERRARRDDVGDVILTGVTAPRLPVASHVPDTPVCGAAVDVVTEYCSPGAGESLQSFVRLGRVARAAPGHRVRRGVPLRRRDAARHRSRAGVRQPHRAVRGRRWPRGLGVRGRRRMADRASPSRSRDHRPAPVERG